MIDGSGSVVSGVVDPDGSGELRAGLAAASPVPSGLEELLARGSWSGELILVLPDTRALDYVEYKLRDGEVSAVGPEVVFRSALVEILVG